MITNKEILIEISKDLEIASESSMEFWDNDIDDEIWNNA